MTRLGRPADAGGRSYWLGQVQRGMRIEQIEERALEELGLDEAVQRIDASGVSETSMRVFASSSTSIWNNSCSSTSRRTRSGARSWRERVHVEDARARPRTPRAAQ